TFVAAQIRPEVECSAAQPRLHHLRVRDGAHESDLLAELPASKISAIEIKASSAPSLSDAKHLIWLRDRLGEGFAAGAVMHTGPHAFRLAERIFAVPICSLWS